MDKRQIILKLTQLTLFLVIVFTVLNIALLLNGNLFDVPYSLYSPKLFAFWSSYTFQNGDIGLGILNFAMFFLIIGTFIYSAMSIKQKPKIVLLALIVYGMDTIAMMGLTYGFELFNPLIGVIFLTLFISFYLINKTPKPFFLVIPIILINLVLWIIAMNDLIRRSMMFDLFFKLWILIILAQSTLMAFKKEKQL